MGYQIEANVFSERVMSKTEAAYFAGIIDGEGSMFLIARKTRGRRSHHFSPLMTVGNTSLVLLHWLVATCGNGRIMLSNRATGPNHRQLYSWQLAPRQIQYVLPQLLPYLIIKRRQAEILLRYFDIQRGGARRDGMGRTLEADIPEVLALYEELHGLNQRGLTPLEPLEFSIAADPGRRVRVCQQEGCADRAYRSEEFCYKHFLLRRTPILKKCEWCGGDMDAIMPKKRFCSAKCQWRSSLERRRKIA